MIQPLTQDRTKQYMQELCLIDKEAFGGNAWTAQNFELQIPGKFVLSRIAIEMSGPVGYLIGSRYARGTAHIHRVAVLVSLRRTGVGAKLLGSFETACLGIAVTDVTLESLTGRDAANLFYESMGYSRISGQELVRYLREKGKTADQERYLGPHSEGQACVYHKMLTARDVRGPES